MHSPLSLHRIICNVFFQNASVCRARHTAVLCLFARQASRVRCREADDRQCRAGCRNRRNTDLQPIINYRLQSAIIGYSWYIRFHFGLAILDTSNMPGFVHYVRNGLEPSGLRGVARPTPKEPLNCLLGFVTKPRNTAALKFLAKNELRILAAPSEVAVCGRRGTVNTKRNGADVPIQIILWKIFHPKQSLVRTRELRCARSATHPYPQPRIFARNAERNLKNRHSQFR